MFKKILDSLYPRRCVLCGQGRTLQRDLCLACLRDLRRNLTACRHCAEPLPADQPSLVCGACQQKPPPYQTALSAFLYAQPLEWLIQQMKFHNKPVLAQLLGELLADALQEQLTDYPEVIIPVPLHASRLHERGFNQALELSRVLSRRLAIPVDTACCQRIRATPQQSGLDAKMRRKNLRGAFEVKDNPRYQHVAIIDDVMSTGSTVNEMSRVLKRAGVERIEVWTLARAGHNK